MLRTEHTVSCWHVYNLSTQETKARWPTVPVSLGFTPRPCFKNKNKEVAEEILQSGFLVLTRELPNQSPAECLRHRETDPKLSSGRFQTAPTKILDGASRWLGTVAGTMVTTTVPDVYKFNIPPFDTKK